MTQDLYARSAFAGQLVVAWFDFNDFLDRVDEQHAEFVPLIQAGMTLVGSQIRGARVKLTLFSSTPGASFLYGVRATTPDNNIDIQLRMLNVRAVTVSEPVTPPGDFLYLLNEAGELLVTASGEALYVD